MTGVADGVAAIVKMVAVENELEFPDEYCYEQAIVLGVAVWQAALSAAAKALESPAALAALEEHDRGMR